MHSAAITLIVFGFWYTYYIHFQDEQLRRISERHHIFWSY